MLYKPVTLFRVVSLFLPSPGSYPSSPPPPLTTSSHLFYPHQTHRNPRNRPLRSSSSAVALEEATVAGGVGTKRRGGGGGVGGGVRRPLPGCARGALKVRNEEKEKVTKILIANLLSDELSMVPISNRRKICKKKMQEIWKLSVFYLGLEKLCGASSQTTSVDRQLESIWGAGARFKLRYKIVCCTRFKAKFLIFDKVFQLGANLISCRSHLDSSVTSWGLFVSASELYLSCKQYGIPLEVFYW